MKYVKLTDNQRKQCDRCEDIIRGIWRLEHSIEILRTLLAIELALIAVETVALVALIVRFLF